MNHWGKHYAKLKAAALILNRPVSRIKLGTPEHLCECRACEAKRRIHRNWNRKKRGSSVPPDPRINAPVVKGCECPACVRRRAERNRLYARRRERAA